MIHTYEYVIISHKIMISNNCTTSFMNLLQTVLSIHNDFLFVLSFTSAQSYLHASCSLVIYYKIR